MQWIIASILALGVAVAVSISGSPNTGRNDSVNNSRSPIKTEPRTKTPDTPDSTIPATVHAVSIPALQAYELTGRDLSIGWVLADTSSYIRYAITYKSDDLTISGILNIPKGNGPFPVLFLNHGYIDTSVYTNGRGLKREQDYFARHGFAVLHSDYRCHAESDCPESDPLAQRLYYAKDVMNAVQAIKNSGDPRLSTNQFGMLGHSMGGGVTQTIMVAKPDLIRAAVLYAPVSSDYRDSYERYTKRRPNDVGRIEARYGAPVADPAFWDNLAPRTFLSRVRIPLMYFQGTKDESVPKEWNDATVGLLKAAGKDVTYVVYDGQPHEFTSRWADFMQQSTDFFNRYVSSST